MRRQRRQFSRRHTKQRRKVGFAQLRRTFHYADLLPRGLQIHCSVAGRVGRIQALAFARMQHALLLQQPGDQPLAQCQPRLIGEPAEPGIGDAAGQHQVRRAAIGADGTRLVDRRRNDRTLLAPPVEVVLELRTEIGLVVPSEAEELDRKQSVLADPLSRNTGAAADIRRARCALAGDLLLGQGHARLRLRQGWRGLHGARNQRIQLRIGVTLPPLGIGPCAAGWHR